MSLLKELSELMPQKPKTGLEAYGVKGMNSTKWRKSFKNEKALDDWCEQNDAEIQGVIYSDDYVTTNEAFGISLYKDIQDINSKKEKLPSHVIHAINKVMAGKESAEYKKKIVDALRAAHTINTIVGAPKQG